MKFGIDRLLQEPDLRQKLKGQRVALLAHPASVTADLVHSLDALAALPDIRLSAAFGPQHGLRGDKQDNMVESADFNDPLLGIPVFSLYGEVRWPTPAMLDSFDVLLVDLQDLGCRIYTLILPRCAMCWRRPRSPASGYGFWTGPTRPAARSKVSACALAGPDEAAWLEELEVIRLYA